MKNYLLKIDSTHGATVYFEINSDSTKPIYIKYCGRDTGRRYCKIGNAARYLEKIAAQWGPETVKKYGTAEQLHYYGTDEQSTDLLKDYYCGRLPWYI